ncbi:MAG TPA: response regulator [Polyangiales bacterium]|nr:response regulator [Polyangiales bacterium]
MQQLWRELFEGPPFEHAVRVAFAQRVIGWMLGPLWIVVTIAAISGLFTLEPGDRYRALPAMLLLLGLGVVTYMRRAQLWLQAAGALCVSVFVTIAATVVINSINAPIYQGGGLVLLALVFTLFGTRWALSTGASLFAAGLLSAFLAYEKVFTPLPVLPSVPRLVLYAAQLLIALLILAGIQRLLGEALSDARRKHREAEEARAAEGASERAFHAMFDQASIGMILLDKTGNIARLNQRAMHWLGASEELLIGRALDTAQLWNEAQRVLLTEVVATAGAGHASRHELTVTGSLGVQRVYQINLSPFHTTDGDLGRVIVEVVEVSDLVRTRTMLAQARRLESLGKLSGGVAHDINNMLAAIQGASDLLRSGRDVPGRIETSREIIQASVSRASALTKQLLAFGRQDRFESVDIDVNRLTSDMGQLFERTLHKNITIRVLTSDEPVHMRGDLAALENALLNLALNAQDAMPDGGTLSVITRGFELDQPFATDLNWELEPGLVAMIRVSDTGSGMSEAVRERMFEPFFTTKPAGKGSGLGLAAVHGTVRNHHGAIVVHTQEGFGSTFDLYFPAANTTQDQAPQADDRPSPPMLSARVLVADDEPLVREALVAILVVAGCEVQVVDSGEALIEALAGGATPDVIISDLMMPGLSGRKLVQTLEATRPGCPLLLITGFTGDDVSTALSGRNNHRLLRKPIGQFDLVKALQDLLPDQIPEHLRTKTA